MGDSHRTVWVLSGLPGAGKSTTARALLRRFPLGLHLPVDDLRDFVVSGHAPPRLDHPPEAVRQFALARTAAAQVARLYADAGFTVAVDDVLWATDLELFAPHWAGLDVRPVLLAPGLAVAQDRNSARTNKSYDTRTLVSLIDGLHSQMSPEAYREAGWAIVDSAGQNGGETVEALLALKWPR
ncbi:AAA family ATPase [Deinococcus apachensis]|uniref:AAA family ATPase n=1 Tax=Deinococcus apachensis TaxID=309886 RepID=UPI0003644CBB|nr:AAA family ATPase [Deinococcus apachensis]